MNELNLDNNELVFDISNVVDILDVVKNYPNDFKIYNSNMTLEYSKVCETKDFEPITNVFYSDNVVECSFSNVDPINNETFIKQLNLIENDLQGLNRDTEDGFIYSDYQQIIIREDIKSIILL